MFPYQEFMPTPNVIYKRVKSTSYGKNGAKELTTVFDYNVPTYSQYGYNEQYEIPGFFEVKDVNDFKYVPDGATASNDGFIM